MTAEVTEQILDNLATFAESMKIYREACEELPERTRSILSMRYGLDGKTSKTLWECSKKYRISRERVRQIEERGIKQLASKIKFKARMKTL